MNGESINDEKLSAKEQHELFTRQDMFEEFTDEQLQAKWKQYLATLEDRPNLKSTLSRDPELQEGGMLLLRIDNHVQDDLDRKSVV